MPICSNPESLIESPMNDCHEVWLRNSCMLHASQIWFSGEWEVKKTRTTLHTQRESSPTWSSRFQRAQRVEVEHVFILRCSWMINRVKIRAPSISTQWVVVIVWCGWITDINCLGCHDESLTSCEGHFQAGLQPATCRMLIDKRCCVGVKEIFGSWGYLVQWLLIYIASATSYTCCKTYCEKL
jgi:hypothetical protein